MVGPVKYDVPMRPLISSPVATLAAIVVIFLFVPAADGHSLAASLLGTPATIVIPADAPPAKLAGTRRHGAEVVTYDRYTEDRGDAFDIYLPGWLARYNQDIFGTIFVINELIVLWLWRSRRHVLQPPAHDQGLDQSDQA